LRRGAGKPTAYIKLITCAPRVPATQDGTTVECKGGTHLDDGQILGMNFYVKGIDDKLPGK